MSSTRNTIHSLEDKKACLSQAAKVQLSQISREDFGKMTDEPLSRSQGFGPYVITATGGESQTTVYARHRTDVKKILHPRFITDLNTRGPLSTELPKTYTAVSHRAGFHEEPTHHGMSVIGEQRARNLRAAQAIQAPDTSEGSQGDDAKTEEGPSGAAGNSATSGVDTTRRTQAPAGGQEPRVTGGWRAY
jgi:hypothetical protein